MELAAYMAEYEDEPLFIPELERNDLFLPTPTALRLLAKLYMSYAPSVSASGDSGVHGDIDLLDFIDDSYSPEDAQVLRRFLEVPYQTFFYKPYG
jgi:hypothetical protein